MIAIFIYIRIDGELAQQIEITGLAVSVAAYKALFAVPVFYIWLVPFGIYPAVHRRIYANVLLFKYTSAFLSIQPHFCCRAGCKVRRQIILYVAWRHWRRASYPFSLACSVLVNTLRGPAHSNDSIQGVKHALYNCMTAPLTTFMQCCHLAWQALAFEVRLYSAATCGYTNTVGLMLYSAAPIW